VSPRRGQAATGEIKRTAGGWAIRYRDSRGRRREQGGFRTKSEAKTALDDELRKARRGPLYRPDVTVRELVDAFLEQYQGAPASKDWLRYYLIKSTDAFGEEPIGSLGGAGDRALAGEASRDDAPRRPSSAAPGARRGGPVAVDRSQPGRRRCQPAASASGIHAVRNVAGRRVAGS
jgi:hypothetical protein